MGWKTGKAFSWDGQGSRSGTPAFQKKTAPYNTMSPSQEESSPSHLLEPAPGKK